MGRVEDSNLHLNALNKLYLSTIETLAMAIDAKDQVTHGHIRRVQAYAVGLAKHVGVTDETLIRLLRRLHFSTTWASWLYPSTSSTSLGRLTPR